MKPLRALSVLVLGGIASNAHAGCVQPPLVLIPPQEEVEGNEQRVVEETQEYFRGMRTYVNCIRAELESGGDDASTLFKSVLVQRNNRAVAEAEAVQRWFNSRFPELASAEDDAASE